jgi:D-beta-D-heptose 7-phosphate kinase/D-beta-D-heptose 1-phosphate adenosyltransferase
VVLTSPPTTARLAKLVERLAGTRVLVVGDVMLDRFVRGAVERISPEAPIPVVRNESEDNMLGGAGNVARNAAALGAEAVLVGIIGDDAAGDHVRGLIDATSRLESAVVVETERVTTTKTRYFGGAHQLLRVDREGGTEPGKNAARALAAAVEAASATAGAIIVSDYAKGVSGGARTAALIASARAAGKPVIVDPKSAEFARYRGATVLTPNAAELAAATGMATAGDEAVEDAARAALDITGADAVVVTRAGEGLSVVQASDARHIRARAREVFDVSGAGDTVAAVIAIGLAAGGSIEDAADLANVAAGIVVGKLGTAVVRRDELLAVLLESGAKTVTLAGAVEHAQRWRKDGHAIAFTNGCFDLIHPGHVSLLRQARAAAGRLIVGLNRDESVRRLKGNARPVQAEAARAAVLSSFAAVDLVVPFAEDTPVSLIEAIRPDVLVKGADYTEKTVVGADLVRSWGGRVLLAEIEPGESSSGIVMRISARDGSASG